MRTLLKLLKRTGRQSSIATALGQASLYKSRYEHVLVVLIDSSPSSVLSQKSLINQGINNFIRELQDFLLPAAENGTFRFNYKWDLNTGHSSNPTI